MKYVAYYRVSTEGQGRSGLGLEAQRSSIQRFLGSVGGQIIAEFTDIQSGKQASREGLQQAISICTKQGANLIVGKLDRLSRDGWRVLVQLEDSGIQYIDAESPNDDEVIKAIKFSLARDERKKISQRTKAALQVKKEQGFKLGSPENLTEEARYKGNEGNRLKARSNPNNIRAAAFAKTLRKQGFNYSEIARELNANGFQSSRGGEIHNFQVRRLIEMFST